MCGSILVQKIRWMLTKFRDMLLDKPSLER
uniref:Uncharacterized protein n=1 Tax=Arundo donax TaxID=35708 RepID=A0A0A8YPV6_ARUDO